MKTTLALLCGGITHEDYLSRRSCQLLCKELDSDKYNIIILDWQRDGTVLQSEINTPDTLQATHKSIIHCFSEFHRDVVVNLTHGEKENCGELQGLLELCKIPYTGNGLTSSVIGMNKLLTKRIFRELGINCPCEFLFHPGWKGDWEKTLADFQEAALQFPLILKPLKGGSSIGIHIVQNIQELNIFIETQYDGTPYIFEEFIQGDDYCVGVFATRHSQFPIIFPLAHINYSGDYFDAAIKYDGTYSVDFSEELEQSIVDGMRDTALMTHEFIGINGFSRCDFIVRGDEFFAIEVNTHPGMSSSSIIPCMVKHARLSLGSFFDQMIEEKLKRN